MKNKIFIGEFIGSAFLVMIIVGSGIMAQNLTRDFAVMLLANTLATGAGLFVLINSIAIESLMSSVLGLNVTPKKAIIFCFNLPFKIVSIFFINKVLLLLFELITLLTIDKSILYFEAIFVNARVSFGKQDPP